MSKAFSLTREDIERAAIEALWVGLITVGALVSFSLGPVPITFQTFFVIFGGFLRGTKAVVPPLLYLLAGLVGLPVFAGGTSGPGFLMGPTAGFALAFPLAGLVAGLSFPRGTIFEFAFYGGLATIIIYLGGMLGLHINMGMSYTKALFVCLPFLPGDALKLIAAAALLRKISNFGEDILSSGKFVKVRHNDDDPFNDDDLLSDIDIDGDSDDDSDDDSDIYDDPFSDRTPTRNRNRRTRTRNRNRRNRRRGGRA
jgi:biotin transport system substrate-specific component